MKLRFDGRWNDDLRRYPFTLVDVGARGGPKPEWRALGSFLEWVAFEPDVEEWGRLTAGPIPFTLKSHVYPNAVFGRSGRISLHVMRTPGFSSVYAPDRKFLASFDSTNTFHYEEVMQLEMDAKPLDELLSADLRDRADFLKIDTEGCAFEVLSGASRVLASDGLMGLQIEAELNPKYEGSPLFGQVDTLLRPRGFELFDFDTCRWKRRAGLRTGGSSGQPIHGDFLFFRSPNRLVKSWQSLTPREACAKVVKAVIVMCLYGIYDLAYELISEALDNQLITEEDCRSLRQSLLPSRSILARLPKLGVHGSVAHQLMFHAFMLFGGAVLAQRGFWKTEVILSRDT